jgi:ferredoxin
MRYTAGSEALDRIIENLRSVGYTVLGPVLSEGVVRLAEVTRAEDLAAGVADKHAPGSYEISGGAPIAFAAVNGPDSPKCFLHPSGVLLTRLVEKEGGFEAVPLPRFEKKYAFFGIRPCDLASIRVLDKTMLAPGSEDPVYKSRRKDAIFVVVNCTRAEANCFCASMGTGPQAESGYELSITEFPGKIILDVPEGRSNLLDGVELRPSTDEDVREEENAMLRTVEQMTRRVDTEGLASRMYAAIDSSSWSEVAVRCLACGNCTMVCPTCFCSTTREEIDLAAGSVKRIRVWDSCLSKDFVYSAGGNPRIQRRDRYRQFVMHKFAYWLDQFGLYGCVGCGRCITWCPVGIDITETVGLVLGRSPKGREKMEVLRVG